MKQAMLALLLGALAACGFQPLGLWPLTFLGVAGLIALVAAAPGWRRALLIGWLWGLAHFALGDNWIATAFSYQAKMPAWLGGVAVVLLSTYLAIYPALAAAGAWWFRGSRAGLILAFGCCWILAEWLRSWMFTGFPWNPLGVVLLGDFRHQGLAWLAPWLGTYALSGVVAMLAGWMGLWLESLARGGRRLPAIAALAAPVLAVWPGWQALPPDRGKVPYTLVQPDIAQDHLDDSAFYEAHYQTEAALSTPSHWHDALSPARRPPMRRLVLWPESGTQEYLQSGYPDWVYSGTTFGGDPALARLRIASALGPGSMLLTGGVDLVIRGSADDWQVVGARNAVTALDDRGQIAASYAKAHLVPFGEYLPLRPLFGRLGLARLVPGDLDFWPGPGPRTLDLGPYGKAGIQICYEIVFSGHVVDRAHRPDYIFNPSNDGWFGSWGPPQHLAQARLRAIEEGIPILRSTTNGISAVIDADGIVRQFAPRGVEARLNGLVPPVHAPTLFARTGNMLPLGLAIALLVSALLALRRARG